jgi:two-component system NtrC family sensor kinase
MFNKKAELIENLTGIESSKLNYYVELKKRNEDAAKQNNRLEIIRQLARDINIDMSIEDILERVNSKLPLAVPCDFLGLALLHEGELYMTAMLPQNQCLADPLPRESFLWQCIQNNEAKVFEPVSKQDPFIKSNPALAGMISSLVVAPLFVRTAVNGLLLVGSADEGVYALEELRFIDQLADQLAICIQNSHLYEQVSRAKKEWEDTFNAVTEPILLIDMFHNILRCNDSLRNDYLPAKTDFKFDEGEKAKCYKALWGRDRVCENCAMEEINQTAKPVYRQVQADNGSLLDISHFPLFNEQNQITAIIYHVKDVTQKTKMETQLLQSAKLAAIGEMAAGVAHELNNPMTVIVGTAQIMLREIDGIGQDPEPLKDIVNNGLRCKKIIQNLLTFSRQDRHPIAPTDLNKEIEAVLSLIQYQINGCRIDITQDLCPDLPIIAANGQQLQQVLINLLLNARDALEGVERDRIIRVITELRQKDGKKWVAATIKDNGTGITPEHLTKIFNPFYTSKEATKGTGLGLSVSLGIAEAHGGTIEVDSVPDEGSSFSLILPVQEKC